MAANTIIVLLYWWFNSPLRVRYLIRLLLYSTVGTVVLLCIYLCSARVEAWGVKCWPRYAGVGEAGVGKAIPDEKNNFLFFSFCRVNKWEMGERTPH